MDNRVRGMDHKGDMDKVGMVKEDMGADMEAVMVNREVITIRGEEVAGMGVWVLC